MNSYFPFADIKSSVRFICYLVVTCYLTKLILTTEPRRRTSIVSNHTLHYNYEQESTLRICHKPRIMIDPSRTIYKDITFQCEGEDYYNATENILKLAKAGGIDNNMHWGRRSFPVSPHMKILATGNSHTRQVIEAFLCQYHDEIVGGNVPSNGDNVGVVQFRNGASLFWAINQWIVFTSNWHEQLQETLGLVSDSAPALNSFDVIIVGDYNKLIPGSKYYLEMMNVSLEHPGMFNMNQTPPDLLDFAVRYDRITKDGLLIGIGPFYPEETNQTFAMQCEILNELGHEGHSYCLDGRRYVDSIHHELGGNSHHGVSLAFDAKKMHRCAGPRGGMADLIVWDLVELFHEKCSNSDHSKI